MYSFSFSHPPDYDHTRSVFPDLLPRIFDFLSQKDLMSAAATCRRWRALATTHRSMFYRLHLDLSTEPDFYDEFCEDLHHVRTHRQRVSVVVHWGASDDAAERSAGWLDPETTTAEVRMQRLIAMDKIMSAIGASLANIVQLVLKIGPVHELIVRQVFSHLRSAARQLREFGLDILVCPPSDGSDDRASIPEDLFGGDAPNLKRVEIDGIHLNEQQIPAFAAASSVLIKSVSTSADLATLFPSADEMFIRSMPPNEFYMLYPLASSLSALTIVVDCRLVDLESDELGPLTWINRTCIHFVIAGEFVPVEFAPFLDNLPADMRLLVKIAPSDPGEAKTLFTTVTITSPDDPTGIVRKFGLLACDDAETVAMLAVNLRPLAGRVVDLHFHERYFDFLEIIFEGSLPVVEHFQMTIFAEDFSDGVLPLDWEPPKKSAVHCPMLTDGTLVNPIDGDMVSIQPRAGASPSDLRQWVVVESDDESDDESVEENEKSRELDDKGVKTAM